MDKIKIALPKKITIEFDGNEYVLTKPSIHATMEMEEKLEASKVPGGKGAARLMYEYVVEAGLPKEIASQLDADGILAVAEALTPSKKK